MKLPNRTALLSILGICAMLSTRSWGYDIDLGPVGRLCDTCGGGVVGGLPIVGRPLIEAQAQVGGVALEQWINISRNSSIGGAAPIPLAIRQQLTGYATEDSMNRVRYKIGDGGFANLARVIEQSGNASAVTLNDLVIFRGPSEANDPALWAHELTHVQQYASWGVRGFAIRYSRDYNAVENEAYARSGQNYWNWANSRGGRPVPAPGFISVPVLGQPPVQQFGGFCMTPIGRFGPGQLQLIGAPCHINTFQGPIFGSIVP